MSKRGAEVFRIAFVALIRHGGARIAGRKAQWSLGYGYGASHGIGDLEGLREGADDVRYATLLMKRIEEARHSGTLQAKVVA